MKRLIIILIALATMLNAAYKVLDDEIKDERTYIQVGSYQILEFDKMISKVRVKDDANIEVSFLRNNDKPLRVLKLFAKKFGKTTLLITFADNSNSQIECYVIRDLQKIISLAQKISPDVIVEQAKGKVILKGKIQTIKHRERIIDLFVKIGMNKDTDILNLSKIENPDKMIRVKLYVAEINNEKGKDIKNQWYQSYQNYTTSYGSTKVITPNVGKLSGYTPQIADAVEGAVTLTGGLTAAANVLGSGFNVGLVLNYLQTKDVARILDETNLITIESQESKFHAGGTIYLKLQTTTKEGVPITEVRPIRYGLELQVKAKEIVNDKFVNLELVTKSTKIDWANQVDGIPSFSDKSVNTYVVIKDKSTIVLGGLINSEDSKNYEKIPLLADIPILGRLFRSESFQSGQSELVFFITPEIVDAKVNDQQQELIDKKDELSDIIKNNEKYEKEKKEAKKEVKKEEVVPVKKQEKQKTNQELHQARMKAILGS